jgi:UDP-N-acetyl-D-galactosamine dehydrogenase
MNLYEKIVAKKENLALIGLGYVGLPIAISFAKKINVIGFDISKEKIELYKKGIDPTKEVGNEAIRNSSIEFTCNERRLIEAKFLIIAVPTPIKKDNTPDLSPLESASTIVGRNLAPGSIIVYESTVYPGLTEEFCIPILERESGLKYGVDFKVGYSPERINPGDKIHRLETIVKIVSGMDEESLSIISKIYELVVEAGVYKAQSIKVAEAAKVIENSQRDINIAFMNELSIIFNKMGIDTLDVLKAAGTKWNFLNFHPGLVGGHCIGIDPYYLTYKAKEFGYDSQIILAGRRLNDGMGKYVAEMTVKKLISAETHVKNARIGILGITFKENCPDVRNSKVSDIISELREYGIDPIICDPVADKEDAERFYNIKLRDLKDLANLDCLIIAVSHKQFVDLSNNQIDSMFKDMPISKKVIIDVKGIKNRQEMQSIGYNYWRL